MFSRNARSTCGNLVVQNHIILHENGRSHAGVTATNLLRRWQWEILEHSLYSLDMSLCDYDLFAKVKEPLRGTRCNTTDELIRAIGRSIRNINKDGRAYGVRCLPNILQKVINMGSDYRVCQNSPYRLWGLVVENKTIKFSMGTRVRKRTVKLRNYGHSAQLWSKRLFKQNCL